MPSIRSLIAFVFVATACGNDRASDLELVQKTVIDYFAGISQHDHQKMIDATTDDFVLYEDGMVWNNDSVFREMDRHRFSVTYTFENFKTSIDRQLAHTTYFTTADFIFDDTVKQTYHFIESAAFKRSGDVWKMTFLHVTTRSERAGQQPRYDTIQYAPEYYAERVAQFKTEPIEKGRIIFLGNSIIEYGNWRKLLGDSSVINRGVAADNTFGVLRRLDDVITRQPGKLIIEIGINDVSQSIPNEIIVRNIKAIVDKVRAASPKTMILVISLLPTNDDVEKEYPDAFNKNHISLEINRQLQKKSKDGSFVYVDLSKQLQDANGNLDRKFAQPDGLHLNDEGYKIFVRLLRSGKYL